MKKIILLIQIILITTTWSFAQNDVDALRYSKIEFGGTARYNSMAGAFGALGGDFSTLSSNPAGIGLFKRSDFSITPSFYFSETNTSYNGTPGTDDKFNFNLGNAGAVIVIPPEGKSFNSILKNYQFGIGVNRVNNFNSRTVIQGNNDENSISTYFADQAWGIPADEIEQNYDGYYTYDLNPAWWTYMIDTIPGHNDKYYGIAENGGVFQRKEINRWGSMNEMVFSLGANFGDRLYIGGTVGIPFIRYFEQAMYREKDVNDNVEYFDELQVYDDLHTTGSGINLKFGMIVRPINFLRIGAAIHSPTWFNNMKDYWYSDFSNTAYGDTYYQMTPNGTYNYDLQTPWRAIGSVSLVLWKIALISADYEYVDYASAKFRSRSYYDYDFYNENTAINNKYTSTQNIRLGAEVRFGHFAVRGGYALYGSPFKPGINDAEKFYYTGGFGFRDKNFYVDLAYVRSESKEDYYLYNSEYVSTNPAATQLITNNVMLTVGLRY